MSESYDRLVALLNELFSFDRADLDFGVFRVMNQRRGEISGFLKNDLLTQVEEAFKQYRSEDVSRTREDIERLTQTLEEAEVPLESSPKYIALQKKLENEADVSALEDEVYSDLYRFFGRYYKDGDFISLRRYKEGVYALPYEGEEIKLHWANSDQYYVKTTEDFHDYRFAVSEDPDDEEAEKRIAHFKLVAAETERDNNQEQRGKERRFVLREENPVEELHGELVAYFEYRQHPEKQAALNDQACETVFAMLETNDLDEFWEGVLSVKHPTEKDNNRTLLKKQLFKYTAKNKFDYFIHKNLRGFLNRELDFFLKNEVLRLDDLDTAQERQVEAYLSKLRILKKVGRQIIAFLAQLEDFQKRLFEKKKFVVCADYCLTLDKVPETLYPEIIKNDEQYEEWEWLFRISELESESDSDQRSIDWLTANPYLVLDTAHFGKSFKDRLLSEFEDLDESTDGLLVSSENFQALNLLHAGYRERVKCIYIDPPYNTGSSTILYKNGYRHSSWLTLMYDRLAALKPMLTMDGAIFVSIDKLERTVLEHAMDGVFGADNRIEELIWSMNTNNSQAPNYSTNHEYVEVYARDRGTAEQNRNMFREPKPGFEEVMALVDELNPSYPPISAIESEIRALYERHKTEYHEEVEAQGLEWEDEKGNDPWKGLFPYSHAEYRDSNGYLVPESEAEDRQAQIWVWRISDSSMPATKQASSTYDPSSPNYRFYKPLHYDTGKRAPHPKSGWKFAYADDEDSPGRRSFVSLDRDHRIVWGIDEKNVPQLKRMLHEVETNVGKSVIQDYSDGEKQTSAMFGRSGVFPAPKHSKFVSRFILHAAERDSTIVDCFAGSGSTAHAVIDLNREDGGNRKYVLAEMGVYFDSVLKPRIQKAIYSKDWRSGRPVSREGSSHVFKYVKVESYEDTLNNLYLNPNELQQKLIAASNSIREDYMISYMLDAETKGSPSLVDQDAFSDPFSYQLRISEGGEIRPTDIDLVETFNYLLGITVERVRMEGGLNTVEGTLPDGDKTLVIWREIGDDAEASESVLEDLFERRGYGSRTGDDALLRVYVNGDNALERLRKPGQRWQVYLIEEEFELLMFGGVESF